MLERFMAVVGVLFLVALLFFLARVAIPALVNMHNDGALLLAILLTLGIAGTVGFSIVLLYEKVIK